MKQDYSNREELKTILQENEYGYIPAAPLKLESEVVEEIVRCAGKAIRQKLILKATVEGGVIEFPLFVYLPKTEGKHKIIVNPMFEEDIPNKYVPEEELIDLGWGFASYCYKQVTSDDADFTTGSGRFVDRSKPNAPGKIALWAWAAMRVVDYLYTRDDIDVKNIGVAGHSRLGKTALLAGAFDTRFAFVHSNDSGAGGARLFSHPNEQGEDIAALMRRFPFWFCPNFAKYIGKEAELPFGQDYLLALIAPRVLSIASAELDQWADPEGEMLCAATASAAWESLGKKGLIAPKKAVVGETYPEGNVGYYVRKGTHYFSREDWNKLLAFFDKHLN